MERIPLLSFFSGGGFLDLGFEQAGFDVVWSNEVHESYADMYRAGISSWRESIGHVKSKDAPLVDQTRIEDLTQEVVLLRAFGSVAPSFFGIIGGPPCQDFSQSGKDLGAEGDRGKLTRVFANLICALRPSFFLMENVPGLCRKKHRAFYYEVVKQLEDGKLGYLTSMRILNALDYGVPQFRDRLFLVGFRKDVVQEKCSSSKNKAQFCWPRPKFEDAKNLTWPTTDLFGLETLPIPEGIPLELTIGQLVGDEAEQLPNGQDAFTPYSKKFKEIKEGDVSGKSFKRLHRYRYSPTVWYGNNEVHLHPWKPRRLTVREALRIQSVPDEYVLPAENSLTDKFRIISNGVPSLLANQIACSLLRYIAGLGFVQNIPEPILM